MSITEYWVESDDGTLLETYREDQYQDAKNHAEEVKGMCCKATFTFDDSELIDDFRTTQERAT